MEEDRSPEQDSDGAALRAEIDAFVRKELKPLRVRASVDEAMRLARVIDEARRVRAGDIFGPFLAPKQLGVVLGALQVQAAGPTAPIVLGILEFAKHKAGCRITFHWQGGPETFDTALVIRAALRAALDEQGLLVKTGPGRPRKTADDIKHEEEVLDKIEQDMSRGLKWEQACARAEVKPKTAEGWARARRKRQESALKN